MKNVSDYAWLTPAGTARHASKGAWKCFRHLALFNRVASEIAFGNISNALIEIPPQHGKSEFWSRYFPAWYIGTHPENRVILTSYGGNFAKTWGRKVRQVIEDVGEELFGVRVAQDSHKADDWSLDGHEGGMVTSGVGGAISGRRGNLLIVDDPISGPKQADSKSYKDMLWEWWDAVVGARENFDGAKVVIATRWAIDDLNGRIRTDLIDTGKEEWTIIKLPAIAEEDEDLFEGLFERKKGDVLCPELFPQEYMERRKKKTLAFTWACVYQQRPYQKGGGDYKTAWFERTIDFEELPQMVATVRAWDLAASEDPKNKQSAGAKMGLGVDHKVYLIDVDAFWKSAGDRDKRILEDAERDGKSCEVVVEKEPGSGGKKQAEDLVRQLAGFIASVAETSGEGGKELRARPLMSAAQNGDVIMVKGHWNQPFRDQVEHFPKGLIDMIDGAAHGYNYITEDMDSRLPIPVPQALAASGDPAVKAKEIQPRVFGAGGVDMGSGGRLF